MLSKKDEFYKSCYNEIYYLERMLICHDGVISGKIFEDIWLNSNRKIKNKETKCHAFLPIEA